MPKPTDPRDEQIADLQKEVEELESRNANLLEQIDAAADDAEVVVALRQWFAKKDVPYEKMDHDTALLWNMLEGK